MTIGEQVHAKLIAEGGFCWVQNTDGGHVVTVHFNRGCSASASLRALLKRHAAELKAFAVARAEEMDRDRSRSAAVFHPPASGSSDRRKPPHPTRGGAGGCECNAGTGFGYARRPPESAAESAGGCGGPDGGAGLPAAAGGGISRDLRLTAPQGEGEKRIA